MPPLQLSESIKSAALDIGFDWCGICPAVAPPGLDRFHQWLESGYHGEMEYLASRKHAYAHPKHVLDGVRSIVMLATGYDSVAPKPLTPGSGRVSRYAWGQGDYHDLIHQRLRLLKEQVLRWQPDASVRGVVDTAPLMEREFAVLAGLGWQGKNTLLLNKQVGSWFFLAALLLDLELPYDPATLTDHCGTCRACLDACPTNAFVQPYLLDATRCISYLTIELRGPIPGELRKPMGHWVFGCDVCQDVCPWNRKSEPSHCQAFFPAENMNPFELRDLFRMDDTQFRARFRKTPLWRPRRRGLLRNAAIVLGNQSDPASIPALILGLGDPEPLVRGAAAWALHQFQDPRAKTALRERLAIETDSQVRQELSGEV